MASLLLLALSATGKEVLLAGDCLAISVYNHPELEIAARVTQAGMIRVPLVGRVQAAGLGTDELAESLGKSWQTAGIADAFVTVIVTEYAPRNAYVIGQVGGGGQKLDIPTVGELTAMQAIISAGGFLEDADLPRVAVLRTVDGKAQRLAIDAVGFANAVPGATDVQLKPGDVVVVPRARPVTVLGLVGTPGTFQIDTSRKVLCSQVIGFAGGLQKGAVRDQVLVLRPGEKDEQQSFVVDVGKVLNGDFAADIPVLPGDTIVVREAERVFVCGQVNAPGALDLDPDVPLTIMRAITLCGGFTEFANQRKVGLIRGRKSMELDLRNVLLDSAKIADDIPLQPGDMIFVRESVW